MTSRILNDFNIIAYENNSALEKVGGLNGALSVNIAGDSSVLKTGSLSGYLTTTEITLVEVADYSTGYVTGCAG